MSIEDLSPRERQIYYCGVRDGKKDGNRLVWYILAGFVIIFAAFISLVLEKH